jgi:hypothetical protein
MGVRFVKSGGRRGRKLEHRLRFWKSRAVPIREDVTGADGRVDIRRGFFLNAFAQISEQYGAESRGARRRIARALAKRAWKSYLNGKRELKATAAEAGR